MYTFLLMIVSEDNKWFPSRNQAYILARMAGKVCLPVRVEKLLTQKKKKKPLRGAVPSSSVCLPVTYL